MKKARLERVNDEIMREISAIIRYELKDPRVSAMTSVMSVKTTSDLGYCKVYVSVMGDDSQKASALEGLKSAAGYIRSQIARRVNLRVTPEMVFIQDDTLEHALKIEGLIKEARLKDAGDDDK